jgi:hypothetical protein
MHVLKLLSNKLILGEDVFLQFFETRLLTVIFRSHLLIDGLIGLYSFDAFLLSRYYSAISTIDVVLPAAAAAAAAAATAAAVIRS